MKNVILQSLVVSIAVTVPRHLGAAETKELDTNSPIKQIVAERYPEGNVFIGCTVFGSFLDTDAQKVLAREFGVITTSIACIQHCIHPSPGVWQ